MGMRLKRLMLSLALAASLCAAASAQPPAPPKPVDSFGPVNSSDWLARLDNFAVELQNDPAALGYIVAHAEKYKLLAWPSRRAHWARGYLTGARGVDPARVRVVDGEFRLTTEFELWLVRAGEAPPFKPLDYAMALSGERAPIKASVMMFYPRSRVEAERSYDYGDGSSPYEMLAALMRADPSLRLCVIGYAARRDRRRGADRRLAADTKREIMTAHALPAERVVALGGGRREVRTAEIWLVPPGAELPRAAGRGRAPLPSGRR